MTGHPPPAGEPHGQRRSAAPSGGSLRTRAGYAWSALVAAALIGLLLLIFIMENPDAARIHLFFWHATMPLGVMILLSVIAGALLMSLVAGWRILQLRHTARQSMDAARS